MKRVAGICGKSADRQRLELLIKKLEAVVAGHAGVASAIAVADDKACCYGLYVPSGPVQLTGRDQVLITGASPEDRGFYSALLGMADACGQMAEAAAKLVGAVVAHIRAAKVAADS